MQGFKSPTIYWAICLLLAIGLFVNGRRALTKAQAATVFQVTPYTVKIRHAVVNQAKGTRSEPGATMTIAVRSDGSRAIVNTTRYAGGYDVSRVVEHASGGRVELGDMWDIKTSWKSREKPTLAKWYRDPKQNCLLSLAGERFTSTTESFLGETSVSGYRASMIQRGGSTEWFALDTGCALLKARHDFGGSVNEQELVALIPGDPEPSLFHVPASFHEVPPSVYLKTLLERLNLPCPERCLKRASERDKHYQENQGIVQ